jgi:hypothetical protein
MVNAEFSVLVLWLAPERCQYLRYTMGHVAIIELPNILWVVKLVPYTNEH